MIIKNKIKNLLVEIQKALPFFTSPDLMRFEGPNAAFPRPNHNDEMPFEIDDRIGMLIESPYVKFYVGEIVRVRNMDHENYSKRKMRLGRRDEDAFICGDYVFSSEDYCPDCFQMKMHDASKGQSYCPACDMEEESGGWTDFSLFDAW